MATDDQLRALYDMSVYAQGEQKIGEVAQVYLSEVDGTQTWVAVTTGLPGTTEPFVPLASATIAADRITVPYTADDITRAPSPQAGAGLSVHEEQRLEEYYQSGGRDDPAKPDVDAGRDRDGSETLVRREERLNVGTEARESSHAQIRKRVRTERQDFEVPVDRETLNVERTPVSDATPVEHRLGDGLGDGIEVTLYAQRAVIDTETVPVETIRIEKQTVSGTETVSADLAREDIDIDTDGVREPARGNGENTPTR